MLSPVRNEQVLRHLPQGVHDEPLRDGPRHQGLGVRSAIPQREQHPVGQDPVRTCPRRACAADACPLSGPPRGQRESTLAPMAIIKWRVSGIRPSRVSRGPWPFVAMDSPSRRRCIPGQRRSHRGLTAIHVGGAERTPIIARSFKNKGWVGGPCL